ncbi:MAG: hypothetical protein M3O71_22100 [Bacteroidota bacterium]|nr:hypothetical protein [Bacteroidota bacterium]
MIRIKSIAIPKPCDKQWEQMTTADNGRHCEHCCKTVTDFTMMTNHEIITYLGSKTNVCGRFYDGQMAQLNGSLNLPKPLNKWWKRAGLAAFIALLFSSVKAEAQVKKMIPIHNTRLIKGRKAVQSFPRKPDSIYCKTLTPSIINIDAEIKPGNLMDAKMPVSPLVVSGVLGGVQVQGIQIEDSSYSFYLSLRELFR